MERDNLLYVHGLLYLKTLKQRKVAIWRRYLLKFHRSIDADGLWVANIEWHADQCLSYKTDKIPCKSHRRTEPQQRTTARLQCVEVVRAIRLVELTVGLQMNPGQTIFSPFCVTGCCAWTGYQSIWSLYFLCISPLMSRWFILKWHITFCNSSRFSIVKQLILEMLFALS